MADGVNYTGDLQRYVLDRLFDKLTGQILLKCHTQWSQRSRAGL